MISAPPATDSSYHAKNTTTTITTKYITSLKMKEEEKPNWNKTSIISEKDSVAEEKHN